MESILLAALGPGSREDIEGWHKCYWALSSSVGLPLRIVPRFIFVCMKANEFVFVYKFVFVYDCICFCICICICICVFICIFVFEHFPAWLVYYFASCTVLSLSTCKQINITINAFNTLSSTNNTRGTG